MSALSLFRALASEFAAKTNTEVTDMIDIVTLWITASVFGARASEAVAELAAHVFELEARRAASSGGAAGVGPVQSIKAGDLAVSYGTTGNLQSRSFTDDALRQTSHGLAFLAIRDSRANVGFGLLT